MALGLVKVPPQKNVYKKRFLFTEKIGIRCVPTKNAAGAGKESLPFGSKHKLSTQYICNGIHSWVFFLIPRLL